MTAVDFGELESDPSDEANAMPANAAPGPPTGLNASPGDRTVTLTWTANPELDIAGYNVYRDGAKVNIGLVSLTTYDPGPPTASPIATP